MSEGDGGVSKEDSDPPPRCDEVFARALPVGPLGAGAREFHHRPGKAPRVPMLPFAVERASGTPVSAG